MATKVTIKKTNVILVDPLCDLVVTQKTRMSLSRAENENFLVWHPLDPFRCKSKRDDIYIKKHKEAFGFPLALSTWLSVSSVLVCDLFKKKWGSYQGERPIVHSKNIISEPSLWVVVVHSPLVSLSAEARKELVCHMINKARVIIIQAVAIHAQPHRCLAAVYQAPGDLTVNWFVWLWEELKRRGMIGERKKVRKGIHGTTGETEAKEKRTITLLWNISYTTLCRRAK